ncbi:unnamed protein product [Cunninghamella blakesleeana]
MPTPKTSSPSNYISYCLYRYNNYQTLSNYYKKYIKYRFLNYNGKQKIINEIINVFLCQSKKYKSPTIITSKKKKLKTFTNDERIPFIAVGNGAKSSSLKGSRHAGLLDISENNGELVWVEIDEFNTSKVCSNCGQKKLINKDSDNSPMYNVLQCTTCLTLWIRDGNASLNIYNLARWQLEGKERPEILSRKGNELDGSDDENEDNEDNEDSDDNDNDHNNNNDDHNMEEIDHLDFDGHNPPSIMNSNSSNNNINNNYDQPFNQPPHCQPLPFNHLHQNTYFNTQPQIQPQQQSSINVTVEDVTISLLHYLRHNLPPNTNIQINSNTNTNIININININPTNSQ